MHITTPKFIFLITDFLPSATKRTFCRQGGTTVYFDPDSSGCTGRRCPIHGLTSFNIYFSVDASD